MGQRTAIVIKRNFADGTHRLDMLHDQWGLGKIMPMLFLRDIINLTYSRDTNGHGERLSLKNAVIYRTPKEKYDYIIDGKRDCYNEETQEYDKVKVAPDIDVWDLDTVRELFEYTDNNNGGMVMEISERYNTYGYKDASKIPPEEYEKNCKEIYEIKIGFLKGSEDTHEPFEKFITADKYMQIWEYYYNEDIAAAFNLICRAYGIIQVTGGNTNEGKEDNMK